MSGWRSPRRFILPPPGSREFAPLLACAALVLMLAAQLALAAHTELPPDPGLSPRRPRPLAVKPAPSYPALAADNAFSPDRSGGTSGLAAAPVETCAAVGVSMIGRDVTALIKARGAEPQLLRVGQRACGWQVSQIGRNTVELVHAGERRTLVVGEEPAAPPVIDAQAPQGSESAQ